MRSIPFEGVSALALELLTNHISEEAARLDKDGFHEKADTLRKIVRDYRVKICEIQGEYVNFEDDYNKFFHEIDQSPQILTR